MLRFLSPPSCSTTRILALVVTGLGLALAGSCAGPGRSDRPGSVTSAADLAEPARIGLRDYRTGVYLALQSGTDEERIEFYSTQRDDAVTKVQDPEVLAAMIEYIDDTRLGELAQEGPAPAVGGQATKALEVRQGERIRFILRRPDMPASDAKAFDEYVAGFQAVYNETYALQAVDGTNTDFRFEPVKSDRD